MELFARCMYYSIHPIMVGWVTIYHHSVWTGHSLCAGSPEPLAKNEMGSHLFYAQENNTNRQNFMTMAKKRKVRLVKFYHPGTEHSPGKNCKPVAHVGWNRGLTTVSSSRQAAAMWMEITKRNTLKHCCFGENGNRTPCCLHATKMSQPAICMSRCSWFPHVSPSR